jgi:hypothetical protein
MLLEFPNIFSKNTQTPNFMKIRPVGTELFHADERTDTTKLTVAFRNFANAPKTGKHSNMALKRTVYCYVDLHKIQITVIHMSRFYTNARIRGSMTRNTSKALCQSQSRVRHSAWQEIINNDYATKLLQIY